VTHASSDQVLLVMNEKLSKLSFSLMGYSFKHSSFVEIPVHFVSVLIVTSMERSPS